MNEEYISNLYSYLSKKDAAWAKKVSPEDFLNKIQQSEYVDNLYNYLSKKDAGWAKKVDRDSFSNKIGFIDVGDIKLTNNLTTPSSDEIKKQYDNGEITHQEYLMLSDKGESAKKAKESTEQKKKQEELKKQQESYKRNKLEEAQVQ